MSGKKLKIKYGDSVFSLPKEKLLSALPTAGGFELKVLMLLASDESARCSIDLSCGAVCEKLDCTKNALNKAISFWEKAGVFDVCDADSPTENGSLSQSEKPSPVSGMREASLPTYTESGAADVIEKHSELALTITECQKIAGKIFSPAEVQTIVGMYDYLGLSDGGYIITLYKYCKSLGKTSARYIEKLAISMADEGVTTTIALSEEIERREGCAEKLGAIRSLIGAGSRALTPKEKKTFECFIEEWKLDVDVIARAYEVTVDNIGEYKLAYMNRVLENWYKAGLTTLSAVEESLSAYQKKKADAAVGKAGFETDEYFEAAIKRSQKYLENSKKDV